MKLPPILIDGKCKPHRAAGPVNAHLNLISKTARVIRMHLSIGAFARLDIGLHRLAPSTLVQLEDDVAAAGIVVNVKAERIAASTLAVESIIPLIFIRLILGSVVMVLAFIVHWSHRQSGVFIIRSNTVWYSTLIPRGCIPLGLHMQTRCYPLYGHVAVFETLCFVIPLME